MKNKLETSKMVTAVSIFESIGLLRPKDIEDWRNGYIKYLEKAIPCNLCKVNRILRIIRFYAHDLNLKPSICVYKRKINKGKIKILQFTKLGEKTIEEAYSRHFIKLGKEKKNEEDYIKHLDRIT